MKRRKTDDDLLEALEIVRSYAASLRLTGVYDLETYFKAVDQAETVFIDSTFPDDVKHSMRAFFRIASQNYLVAMQGFQARKARRFAWLGEFVFSIADFFTIKFRRK